MVSVQTLKNKIKYTLLTDPLGGGRWGREAINDKSKVIGILFSMFSVTPPTLTLPACSPAPLRSARHLPVPIREKTRALKCRTINIKIWRSSYRQLLQPFGFSVETNKHKQPHIYIYIYI